ncbi:MAG: hypothetical protein IK012_08000 [Fibrobacter sp.]|uniref:hypothetical protein n=1 Tax=Fibrobacter sp. TaxID=35828 RepID=UPI0025C56FB0|nr:hypothetical protein [Fibrobacter sp.]MBR4785179.1 hypothetical protein [Fibrobacter sp.]
MVTLMNILAKQTARMAMLLSIFVGLLATEGLAAKKGEPAVTHISFADSAKNHLVNIRAQISDSVLVTNLANAPTHYDNAMFVRLFLDGHFTQAFHFDARVMVSNDYTNRYINDNFYHPSEGLPYNKQSETRRTWDQFSAKIDYQLKPVTLLAGFDYLEFGPARYNHVILRGNRSIDRPWQDTTSRIWRPAPTPYFGYRFEIGPIEYSQYAAKLFEKKNKGKYMHAHRLDLHLPFNITLGLSETALYGSTTEPAHTNPNADADSTDRDFEWNYVLPFIMYNFQEHIQGDQDNISLAFDLSVRTLPHWEFYGELLWDDMKTPTSMFDDSWWGNKWGATVGIARDSLYVGPVRLDMFTEYTRIEPWVYTHHKGGGYTYASYSQNLGSDLGPNSQEFHAELSATYKFINATFFTGNVAKDTAFGGNITDIHGPEDAINKVFLNEETTLRYTELGARLEITPWHWMSFRAGYTRYFGDYEGYRASASGSLQW